MGGSYFFLSNTWFSGILLLFLLMAIAFMGYVLPFGQMSFWGATVITNLLSPFPSLIEWICGGYCIHNPSLKRFFLFHFQLPFFLFIFIKDVVSLTLILSLYFLQTHFGISSLSHPDNALEACALLTPAHIVPEWYFLCQYAMLKAVPNKNAGLIILLTSKFILTLYGEIINISSFTGLMGCNNGFSLSCFFLSFLSFLWIGTQFPQEKFISYARILTLY